MTTQTEALNIAIDYMNERLEEHDAKYQRHPATEDERNNILADIKTVKEALAQPEHDCTRSHPHEEMSKECELRTEIARLRNQLKQRTWVGLSEQEKVDIVIDSKTNGEMLDTIGAKLRELNEVPQRTWVGLTDDEEMDIALEQNKSRHWVVCEAIRQFKEKNQ